MCVNEIDLFRNHLDHHLIHLMLKGSFLGLQIKRDTLPFYDPLSKLW